MTFNDALIAEFNRRRDANPRYSLRAFARALGISHSSASRLCRGRRPSAQVVALLGPRLGWSGVQVAAAVARTRVDHLRDLAAGPFVVDARWIASRTGMSLDDVQVALHEAVRTGRLTMTSTTAWTVEA